MAKVFLLACICLANHEYKDEINNSFLSVLRGFTDFTCLRGEDVVVWCWEDRWGGGVDTCNPDPDLYFLEIEITKSLDSHIALPKICIKF